MEASSTHAVPSQSFLVPKFDEEMMELDKEFTDFFDRFQKVVLVSFGTMFVPSPEEINNIIGAINLFGPNKVLGFII